MSVFGLTEQVHRSWRDLSDLDRRALAAWENSFKYPNAEQMPMRLSTQELEPILHRNQEMIAMVEHDLALIDAEIGIPHFFVVTDLNGIVIHFIGQEEIIEKVRGYNVDVGTSFAFEMAGINGISLAMRMQSTVVVQGAQHTMRILKDWTCICSPVRLFDEIYGYVDLSFGQDVDVTFAVPLLKKTIEEMESKFKKSRQSSNREEAAYSLFESCNLSNREKEVAFGWLQNRSALQIAHTMGITEGTVRNMLKKVYAKMGVSDKGQFFRKFLV